MNKTPVTSEDGLHLFVSDILVADGISFLDGAKNTFLMKTAHRGRTYFLFFIKNENQTYRFTRGLRCSEETFSDVGHDEYREIMKNR